MPNNKVIAAFALSSLVIVYCAIHTLAGPATQRIEREFGVSVVKWK